MTFCRRNLSFPRTGRRKQDYERNTAKRWLGRHGPAVVRYQPTFLGDDLFACQPIAEAIRQVGGNCVLTCKLASPGFGGIWVSSGEAEGPHFVGVLSFGDEFREDGALGGIQEKFGEALA
jgi:hypothetical protein